MSASSSRPPASSGSDAAVLPAAAATLDGARSARRRALVAVAVTGAVIALDQLSKHWAVNALDDGHAIDLVGSLRLKLTFNSGASFSIGTGWGGWIAVVGLVALGVAFRTVLRWPGRLAAIGLGVTAGGALGNIVDRLLRRGDGFLGGHVVDFVDLQWWPVFNVADMAIYVGAGLLLLASLRQSDEPATAGTAAGP